MTGRSPTRAPICRWRHKLLAALNPRYTRVDPPFVTGMGPKAARKVAREIIRSH